jgi:iron complex outermembrane receptor protein
MGNLYCADKDRWATVQCLDILPLVSGIAASAGAFNRSLARATYDNVGIYGQGTYELTEKLKLTGGLRYTWDTTRAAWEMATYNFPGPGYDNPVARCFVLDPSQTFTGTNLLDISSCREDGKKKSSAPTWVLGLDYKFTPDVLIYTKYSRGYRQGSMNPLAPPGLKSFDQEKVDTYEAGLKTSFRGKVPGTFNVSLFYNDFRDQQLQVTVRDIVNPFPAGDPRNVTLAPNPAIVNAGRSRIYGAEVESSISPFKGLTLHLGYAYLNSKLQEMNPPPLPDESVPGFSGVDGYDIVSSAPTIGNPLPYTPKHKLTVGADYRLPFDEGLGKITLGTTYVYTSRIFYADSVSAPPTESLINGGAGDDPRFAPSYDLVNFNVNWENIARSGIDATFFVTNAFNKKYYLDRALNQTSGYVVRYFGTPQMYGVKVRYNF